MSGREIAGFAAGLVAGYLVAVSFSYGFNLGTGTTMLVGIIAGCLGSFAGLRLAR